MVRRGGNHHCSTPALKPVFMCVYISLCGSVCVREREGSAKASPNILCHSEAKWHVYMWIISSLGGECFPSVDHKLVLYFRWYTSPGEHFYFFPSPDLNYIHLVLFCDFIFGLSVAMAVMLAPLEHTRMKESTFHVIVKTFQTISGNQGLLQSITRPPPIAKIVRLWL